MDGEAKLIAKLLGKITSRQAVHDAVDKLLPVRRAYVAMFKAAAHLGAGSPVPEAFGFGEDELHTPVYCFAVAGQ